MKFIKAGAADEVSEGQMWPVEVEGEEVVLACVEGQIYAFEGICSHGLAHLDEGDLRGHEVICPLHDGAFDVRTGAPSRAPCTVAIKSYPVKIEGDALFIGMGAA